jgi:hypothetical protein
MNGMYFACIARRKLLKPEQSFCALLSVIHFYTAIELTLGMHPVYEQDMTKTEFSY